MKFLLFIIVLNSFTIGTLRGATVENVSSETHMVTLRLTKSEGDSLQVGDLIKVTVTANRPTMIGKIQSINGRKIEVLLSRQPPKVEEGKLVNVASKGFVPVMIKQKRVEGDFTGGPRFNTNIFPTRK